MTHRVEKIGDSTLYLGDCRELLPGLQDVESIITDPVWPNVSRGCIPGWEDPWGLFKAFCEVLPADIRQLVVCLRNDSDPRILAHVPERLPFQQMAWCQYVMPGYLGRVLGGNECAYVFGKPVKRQQGRKVIPSISPKAQPSDRPPNGHPCSRALVHQKWLVNWFSDEGELVCDPFMGSGTTGVACVDSGRPFVGIEIDPGYFDLACERVEDALRQGRLFGSDSERIPEAEK